MAHLLAPTWRFSAVNPCDLSRTTAGFARRRSESDCFQKQLRGDTLKLLKTCALIFKCRQTLHQNAAGHPIPCRTLSTTSRFHLPADWWNLLAPLALACKSFLLQKAYSKGTHHEVEWPLQLTPTWNSPLNACWPTRIPQAPPVLEKC